MKISNDFILFDNLQEFKTWLLKQKFTRKIKLIQNHHTWLPDYKTFKSNHFALLEGMKKSHLERGFSTIAQNLTTFPDGKIAVCRDFNMIPAGIKGANTYGLCIEHVGNFDLKGDVMNDVHKNTIVGLNAVLCQYFKLTVDTNSIVYHHWFDLNTGVRTNGKGSTKSCPGVNFFGGNTVETCQKNFIPKIKEWKG